VLAAGGGDVGRVRLSLARQGNHVLARGSAPVGDYMQLEVFRGGALRFRALFILNRFNAFSLALPAALGNGGLTVRVFQFSGGLSHAAQQSI
jgi:hypothetical protein